MSVRENAKSNRRRKPDREESGGAGRKFTHLTWGSLRGESREEESSEAVVAKRAAERRPERRAEELEKTDRSSPEKESDKIRKGGKG
jgi:hypothetical protein